MNDDELREALRGLFAYDMGAPHLGVRDAELRDRCKAELHDRRSRPDWAAWLAGTVNAMWLAPGALADGHDAEDAAHFLRWLPGRMACPLEAAPATAGPGGGVTYNRRQREQIAADAAGRTVESLAWEPGGGYWVMTFTGGSEMAFRLMAELGG